MICKIDRAKADLAQLIDEARSGKEVLIAAADGAVVKLVPLFTTNGEKRKPGRLKGKISYTDDSFAPLTRNERKSLGFE